MILPDYVARCVTALEANGYEAWAVGGCVRDPMLGLQPHDYDLCTCALPEETEAVFAGWNLVLSGKKHGTVGVITEGGVVEITTFRTEGGYTDSRHPDWVRFVPEIREDLARRDFTVNAMAWSPTRGLKDPFGGREDLENRILRAVGDPRLRFREDALRILRGVRFACRYHLTIEEETLAAMVELAPLMEELARERVFAELSGILPVINREELLRFGPILAAVLPELEPTFGFDQRSPHHAYDLFTHTAHVTGQLPPDPALRWAGLLHDVGKIPTFTLDETGRGHFYGHAAVSAEMADRALLRLKAPTALRRQTVTLIEKHMTPLLPDRKLLRRRIAQLGWETVEQLLAFQKADMGSKGTGEHDGSLFTQTEELLEQLRREDACLSLKDLAVTGHDLMALGYRGKAIGQALETLLEAVVEERLPNEKNALLCSLEVS